MSDAPSGAARSLNNAGRARPAQWVALAFLIAIAVGTLLLSLPISHAPGAEVGWLDALFTATSAVCVTGLVVVDTGTAFSPFGQTVVALLIQAGGLGILTLGALVALLIGSKVGYRQRRQLQQQVGALHTGGVVRLVRGILLVVLAAETVLLAILWPRFAAEHGALDGLAVAAFHAVSAFNNAGFSTYADSLGGYVADPWVVLTVATAFIVGGLGHPVLIAVVRKSLAWRKRLPLHARLAIAASAGLLVAGTVAIAAFEWRNPATLGSLGTGAKWLTAFFQAATPRTAGFTTVDPAETMPATQLLTMMLMFIGGSPGSTAGGIKTVTFLVLVGSTWSWARGRGELAIGGRRLASDLVIRAGMIAFLGALVVMIGAITLTALEPQLGALPLTFEAVSAFGTVGLSMGVTEALGPAARWVVIALMLVGRLGPLTVALALVQRPRVASVRYPSEDVMVG